MVSANTAIATVSTAFAKISGITLGRMCLRMMCRSLEPTARARSTKGASFTESTPARTTRAVPAQLVKAMTRMMIA